MILISFFWYPGKKWLDTGFTVEWWSIFGTAEVKIQSDQIWRENGVESQQVREGGEESISIFGDKTKRIPLGKDLTLGK